MRRTLNRRSFVQAFGVGVLGARGSFALAATTPESLAIPFLGDLHFDKLAHHDLAWLRESHPGDVRQVENYSRVTEVSSPLLLRAVQSQVASATASVPFLLQLGDLMEGLCGTPALAEVQAKESVAWLRSFFPQLPFTLCKGNHDITGPGAAEVYDRILLPALYRELQDAEGARHTLKVGGSLMVFFDAYDKGSLAWLERLLSEKQPERLIFIIHPPVVPYNARSSWHIYARPSETEQRQRLLNLLGQHHAVVLCGHLHKYSCVVRKSSTGQFVQLAISSVATDAKGEARDAREGLEAYNADLVELEPKHSPETAEARRALLEAERPFITHYEYADTWGHGVLELERGGALKAKVCRGTQTEAWKQLDLSAMVHA